MKSEMDYSRGSAIARKRYLKSHSFADPIAGRRRKRPVHDMATKPTALSNAFENRHVLGFLFLLPAGVLLLLFLTYPLGLGTWLGFTDAKVGRAGEWIGLENYEFLWNDSVTRLALFNTLFYTAVASVFKFFLGLWLAVLLNKNIRFKTFFRAVILLPYIVPTALSAIAFWWIYDAQFSIISWVLVKMGLIDKYIDFLGDPWNARLSVIAASGIKRDARFSSAAGRWEVTARSRSSWLNSSSARGIGKQPRRNGGVR